jgi:VanZ family protein
MNKIIKVTVSWILVLLWMLLIFRLSSQVAAESNGLSLGITGWIQNVLEKFIRMDSGVLNHLVRKGAHFSAYMLLAVFSSNAVHQSGISGWKGFAAAFGICVLYASSDEIHQLFVAGRSGQSTDVLIDSLGALVGMGIALLIGRAIIKLQNKKLTVGSARVK